MPTPGPIYAVINTNTFPTNANPSPLNTGTFTKRTTQTPGNVGVCFSGGGSRAFSAGIGQLQALESVTVNGASLLSQVRAMSTVSGGGWIGIPFCYRLSTLSDSDFLGTYTPPADLTYDGIGNLPPEGIAQYITDGFSIEALTVQAGILYAEGVPSSLLWQVLMGETFLEPFSLYVPGAKGAPTTLFSYNAASEQTYIAGPNPAFDFTVSLVAQATGQQRPYLISLFCLSVQANGQQMLTPVQCTPFATGIFSTPAGATDANNRPVGGGGVSSFAFDSAPESLKGNLITALQTSQWSLMDTLGTSSSAFAEFLISTAKEYAASPAKFAAALEVHGPAAVKKLSRNPSHHAELQQRVKSAITGLRTKALVTSQAPELYGKMVELSLLESIVPAYQYWSVVNPPLGGQVRENLFADGGLLENSGVASMLSYSDIDNVVALLNVETPISTDGNGNVILDDTVPPLFGYQPYDATYGYVTYAGNTGYTDPLYQYSQVFPSNAFAALQQGLASAAASGGPAVFSQVLTTVANSWFGVKGGKQVTVVWNYLNYSRKWFDLLDYELEADIDLLYWTFPNYSTMHTGLSGTEINLLSNFTAWTIKDSDAADLFTALFQSS